MAKKEKLKISVHFEYADGTFKTVPYEFKDHAAYEKWVIKVSKDQSVRKIRGSKNTIEKSNKPKDK